MRHLRNEAIALKAAQKGEKEIETRSVQVNELEA